MNIAKFFIDRKVLTWTLSLVFFAAGVSAYRTIGRLEAVVIVVVVLLFFMGLRSGLIIGGVLVLTVMATLAVMKQQGVLMERISLGADPFYAAMSVTVMCGLAFATLLTLVVIPVFYALFFRLPKP